MRQSSKLTPLALLSLSLILLTQTSCVTAQTLTAGTANVVCGSFKVITYSKNDTDETIIQIRAHNAAYRAICPTPKAQ